MAQRIITIAGALVVPFAVATGYPCHLCDDFVGKKEGFTLFSRFCWRNSDKSLNFSRVLVIYSVYALLALGLLVPTYAFGDCTTADKRRLIGQGKTDDQIDDICRSTGISWLDGQWKVLETHGTGLMEMATESLWSIRMIGDRPEITVMNRSRLISYDTTDIRMSDNYLIIVIRCIISSSNMVITNHYRIDINKEDSVLEGEYFTEQLSDMGRIPNRQGPLRLIRVTKPAEGPSWALPNGFRAPPRQADPPQSVGASPNNACRAECDGAYIEAGKTCYNIPSYGGDYKAKETQRAQCNDERLQTRGACYFSCQIPRFGGR